MANFGVGAIDGGDWRFTLDRCLRLGNRLPAESRGGESWFYSGFHFTAYNHCTQPNPVTDDCSFDDEKGTVHALTLHAGSFAATSHHSGTVLTLFMDGSVHNHQNSINLAIWQAISTRNGGEIISADFL